MTEAELQKICKQLLAQSGLLFWRVSNGPVIHRLGSGKNVRTFMKKSEIAGFPDFAGVTKEGTFFALELKSEKGKVSPEQMDWQDRLSDSNAIVGVARTPDHIRQFIATCGGRVKQIV